jgi:hypothetical protein
MRSRFIALGFLAVSGLALGSAAQADTVNIQNSSFETLGSALSISCGTGCSYNNGPIPNWTATGSAGSWDPSSAYFSTPVPDGNTVAYVNGGSISQTLTGVALLVDTTYTLSVYVGHRLDGLVTDFAFGIDAGSNQEDTFTGSNGSIAAGTFGLETLSFTTGSTVDPGQLTIFLTDLGPQADFDNVQLTAVSAPEPSSLLLLGVGLSALFAFGLATRNRLPHFDRAS